MTAVVALYKFLVYFSLIFPVSTATEVSGIVLDKNNHQPVPNVYIYTIKGEEETLSRENGSFKLLSWEKLPVTVSFEKKGYKPARITINKDQKNKQIVLESY